MTGKVQEIRDRGEECIMMGNLNSAINERQPNN